MWIVLVILLIVVFLQIRFNLFVPEKRGFRILMYHKISDGKKDMLTVSHKDFVQQMDYLEKQNYKIISILELLESLETGKILPQKSILITFDDGYFNNFNYVLPLLKQKNWHATIFLPVAYIGNRNQWDSGQEQIMDYTTLKSAVPYFEYGLHSFSHKNIAELSLDDFQKDLYKCLDDLTNNNLKYFPVLAYPFGKFPKKKAEIEKLKLCMKELGIKAAFRIGNRVNPWPLQDPYLIERIDIRGTDSFWEFKTKLKKGSVKMF